jgi:polysaccharide chain length determinant protein (PEP-CTERM system associated)
MLGHRKLQMDDYVAILKRRLWIIAIPVVLLPIIAVAITFRLVPQYLSQTLVLIEEQRVPDAYVKPVISADLDSRLSSMKEQILSRSRIQPIIERYNLYGTEHLTMDDRIDLARKAIGIKPIHSEIARSGGLPGFFVSFTASDARTAQLICGEITSLFLSENLRSREAAAEGTTDFLKNQLADAKRNLDEQDARLADFQRQYVGKLPGEEAPNLNMLTSLNTQLEAATQALARMEQDKTYEESMLAEQGSTVQVPLGAAEAGVGSATGDWQAQQVELQTLLTHEAELASHYTADHPDLIELRQRIRVLRTELAKVPTRSSSDVASPSAPIRNDSPAAQQLRSELRAAELGIKAKRQEQAQIQNALRIYQDRIQSSPLVAAKYKELTRDYETAQKFYDDLLAKMNQSKMATDLERRQEGEQFRVMDEPNLPDSPIFPKRTVFLLGGLASGLALGFLITGIMEYRDTSLRTERDIWTFTQLDTLAVISFSQEVQDGITHPVKEPKRWSLFSAKGRDALSGADD